MPLTDDQRGKFSQAIAGRNQRFLQELQKLSADMSKVFGRMQDLAKYLEACPDIALLTDENLAELSCHFDAADLVAALSALSEIGDAAIEKNWTTRILRVY